MQASLFEFRHRWWVIFFIFFIAFLAYSLDPVNCGVAIVGWLAKHLGTTPTANAYRLILAFSALFLEQFRGFANLFGQISNRLVEGLKLLAA